MKKNLKIFTVVMLVITSLLVVCLSSCESNGDTSVKYTVTFNLNYDGAKATTEKVESGKTVKEPSAPVRDGYDFLGWFTATENGEKFAFDKAISADVTVYAHWNKKGENTPDAPKDYIMEAEDVDLSFVQGGDTSASPSGASLIVSGAGAHGGAYIRALYVNELYLEFEFVSDKAVSGATLTFAFAGEFKDFTLNNEEFEVFVNPELNDDYFPVNHDRRVKYEEISLEGNATFSEFTLTAEMNIKEGKNIVYLLVNNTDSLAPTYSTMNAKAPMIDYMKITTTATLTQTKFKNE